VSSTVEVTATPPPGEPDGAPAVPGPKKRRLDHVDAMRPVKQAGVVGTHTLLAFAPGASIFLGASLVLLHVTREAFLFVSACMLTYSYRSLGRGDWGRFYRRRFVSVGLPYLCWTVIYFFVTFDKAGATAGANIVHLGYLVVSGYYQLYYLLVIMQFYVLFPLLLWLLRHTERHGRILLAGAAFQVTLVSLIHWQVTPAFMQSFWATREVTSYTFYLLAGAIVALHLEAFHDWLLGHARAVLLGTLAAAVLAEAWFVLATRHVVSAFGSGGDPLQPIAIPFNIGAIACIYLLGVYLVDPRRSPRLRAMVRSGSDNSYGVYLSQLVFIAVLGGLGWRHITHVVPWPIVSVLTVVLVFGACVFLTAVLARTSLSVALTGRQRESWRTFLPFGWGSGPSGEAAEDLSPISVDQHAAAPERPASVVAERPTSVRATAGRS
jgi:peptidoglycan/LPS O-acetylase OafA/YrhL